MPRCNWVCDVFDIDYHDTEWGTPVHDDRRLFEFLVLNGFQPGPYWNTILRKRTRFRAVFDNFDAARMVRYDDAKIEVLLTEPGIIRDRHKIEAAIHNAQAFLVVQAQYGSFDAYLERFVPSLKRPVPRSWRDTPTICRKAKLLSRDLRRRGFVLVYPTLCYAFMQSVGLVNDHIQHCDRGNELRATPWPTKPHAEEAEEETGVAAKVLVKRRASRRGSAGVLGPLMG